jgi:hypothetical protein
METVLMERKLQIRIPQPCHERWEAMSLAERGRFCGACNKTVVDLTGLTHVEVLAYLARAGQGVCGRFSPEQLGRGMEMRAASRGRWWWRWLVAGLLLSFGEARGQQRVKPTVSMISPGGLVAVTAPPASVKALPVTDSVKVLPEVVVLGYGGRRSCSDLTGAVMVVPAKSLGDTIREKVSDTLSMMGLLPRRMLTVYPNPVRRGMVTSLGWEGTETGEYEVALFSGSGGLIQRRVIMVKAGGQVDLLEIPVGLAPGVYFLRVARAGGGGVLSRKLVVL